METSSPTREGTSNCRHRKRRHTTDSFDLDSERINHPVFPDPQSIDSSSQQPTENGTPCEELWIDQSFYSVIASQIPTAFKSSPDVSAQDINWNTDWWSETSIFNQETSSTEHSPLRDLLSPGLPPLEKRTVNLNLVNPYADSGPTRNPVKRASRYKLAGSAVNGYVKFRLRPAHGHQETSSNALFPPWASTGIGRRQQLGGPQPPGERIPHLPPDFGGISELDNTDWKLLKFYTVAYCEGRTILPKGNYWLTEFPSMAAVDDSIKHALLALAGAYVLDYVEHEALRHRVNQHYYLASGCISKVLGQPETHEVGKGEAIISAIVLLMTEDLRKSNGEEPHWLRGAYLAKSILDHTDPGYRYWKTENVQCSRARVSNGNIVAQTCILAQVMLPLEAEEEHNSFGWLLEGTHREVRRIRSTGLCPKLLHILYQITSLCSRLKHNPRSDILPQIAERILEKLDNFYQWSELSGGYSTTAELLEACRLDEHGRVSDAAKVVEITGESWVWCAKIYLQCRFFRKPFSHPDVLHALGILRTCLRRLPFDGELFTSQFPFFAVALASLLSSTDEDRALPREWFNGLVAEASCRSSIPPVWDTIQKMWAWMDTSFAQLNESYEEKTVVGERRDWWEEMVTWLLQNFGYMHLA